MKKLVFVLLLFSNIVFSQQKIIKSKIIDSKTKEPIFNVSIKFDKKTAYTDYEGNFKLIINNYTYYQTNPLILKISSIEYKEKILVIDSILTKEDIYKHIEINKLK